MYVTKAELNPAVIGLLLFFIMGPAEEIYWRGFVQETLTGRFGRTTGLLVTSAIYALVHIFAFNFMLLIAAAVCGLFWGLLYLRGAKPRSRDHLSRSVGCNNVCALPL